MLDLSVIVPVRNAERLIEECLASIVRAQPREIIVVDGLSTDRTREIAQRYPVRVLSDEGRGVAAARVIGAQAATSPMVALIDVDIVLPDGALAQVLEEFKGGGYTGLQAGLHSVSGSGYWGQALAQHHNYGRSKNWPGVMATIFDRAVLLKHSFDQAFLSGEDIELRWRLRQAGAKLGVSKRTVVTHSFEDTWKFAKGQWRADGEGLARMVMKHGLRSKILLGLPLAAAGRGILLSLMRREPKWIPYWLCYLVGNYIGMLNVFAERFRQWAPKVATG